MSTDVHTAQVVEGITAACYCILILQLRKVHNQSVLLLFLFVGEKTASSSQSQSPTQPWYKQMLSESDAKIMEHSGKMVLLFEILRMAEDLDDKVYVSFLTP